jgi:hypothetical protein
MHIQRTNNRKCSGATQDRVALETFRTDDGAFHI